jgi:selenocysteine lyase/cysteine desulfurase
LGVKLEKLKIPFIVNATQSLGVFPVSSKESRATAIVASCHKWMNAGYGSSILYMHQSLRGQSEWPFRGWLSVQDPSQMDVNSTDFKTSASAIETGIPPFNLLEGLNVSLELILDLGVNNTAKRILELSSYLHEKLKGTGIDILSTRDDNQNIEETCNSGTISISSKDPEIWVDELQKRSIFASARRGSVRIAVSYYNNEQDIDQLIAALKELQHFNKE